MVPASHGTTLHLAGLHFHVAPLLALPLDVDGHGPFIRESGGRVCQVKQPGGWPLHCKLVPSLMKGCVSLGFSLRLPAT